MVTRACSSANCCLYYLRLTSKANHFFFFQFYFTLAPSLELWLSISNDFLEKKKLSGEMKSQQQNLHFYRSECVRTLSRAKNVLQLISLDALYIIEKFLMLRAAAEANFFATNSIRNLTTTDETGKSVNWKWKVKKHETQLQTERSSNPNGFDWEWLVLRWFRIGGELNLKAEFCAHSNRLCFSDCLGKKPFLRAQLSLFFQNQSGLTYADSTQTPPHWTGMLMFRRSFI